MHAPIARSRLASYAGALIGGLLFATTVNIGGFVPLITDSSGYVSAAELWRRGETHRPTSLPLWANWPNAVESASPVAYRPGQASGTEVPIYPLGFPLLCAAAVSLGGPLGSYLVAPFFGAILIWCTFALARRMAGEIAGLLAAALLATSPVVLLQAVHPMSDLPAAAFWALSLLMALRGTPSASVAAGLCVTAAVLIRPNLAPLAIVPGVTALIGGASHVLTVREWRVRAAFSFLAASAVGPFLVAWSQALLYGNPLESGYGPASAYFSSAHIGPNLSIYPRLLVATHTWLPFTGLLMLVLVGTGASTRRDARIVAVSLGALLLLNVLLYLPYLSFDSWPFLRLLLPGLMVLFILFASLLAHVCRWLTGRRRWLLPLVLVAPVMVVAQGAPMARYALKDLAGTNAYSTDGELPQRSAAAERRRAVVCAQRCDRPLHGSRGRAA